MTDLYQPASAPQPVSIDRVRVIRRSMRCFVFGILGCVPILGLPMSFVAFRLHRQICDELGEKWDFKKLHAVWAVMLFLIAGLLVFRLTGFAAFFWCVLVVAHFLLVRTTARAGRGREWNPAARLVYWGVALADVGRGITVGILVVVASLVFSSFMG